MFCQVLIKYSFWDGDSDFLKKEIVDEFQRHKLRMVLICVNDSFEGFPEYEINNQ
jgi:hypothetical protein